MSNSRKPHYRSTAKTGVSRSSARVPAEVYRYRRLALASLTLMVLTLFTVGIVLLVQAVQANRETGPDEVVNQSTEEAQAPGPEAGEGNANCPAEAVAVTAATDKESYDPATTVKLELSVQNNNDYSCEIAVGSNVQSFSIKQDGKVVWSSDYCLAGDQEESVQVFAPGAKKRSVLAWDMVPTDQNCNRTSDTLAAGVYQFTAKLGEAESNAVEFTVKGTQEETSNTEQGQDGQG